MQITPLGESLLSRLTGVLLEEYRTVGPELVRALQAVLRALQGRRAAGPDRSSGAPGRRFAAVSAPEAAEVRLSTRLLDYSGVNVPPPLFDTAPFAAGVART